MKKLKVFWPSVIAITIAVSVTSCMNENIKKEETPKIDVSQYHLIDYDKKDLDEIELPEIEYIQDENGVITPVEVESNEKEGKTR